MKFVNKKVIIFDLDGTLIDSVPDLALSINDMLEALHRNTFSQETIRFWVGNGAPILVKRALLGKKEINKPVDEKLFQKALSIFLDAYKKNLILSTHPYPHVTTTLHKLSQDYTLALVTNKPFIFIEPILKNLGINMLFKVILGGDSLKEKKPSGMPLLHVCKQLKITPKEAVMVGDSSNDVLSAKSASIQTIGVSYGYNYGESIERYSPDIIIDQFDDILSLFRA